MELKATIVPYSSVVGSSVMLTNKNGLCVAILAIQVPNSALSYRETSEEVAKYIEERINK